MAKTTDDIVEQLGWVLSSGKSVQNQLGFVLGMHGNSVGGAQVSAVGVAAFLSELRETMDLMNDTLQGAISAIGYLDEIPEERKGKLELVGEDA